VTDPGGTWAPERRLFTVALIGLVTAAAFEGMAVPTVLPAMADELGDLHLYGWAFSAFWLTNIVGITLAGADADRRGPARALAVGTVLFAGGMLVSGLAPSMPVVVVGRAIQGFGSGALGSVVYASIARAYPPAAAPRMIALVSSAWVVPGLIGPALAGVASDSVGWRWVFLAIIPAVLLMGFALYVRLAGLGPDERADEPARSGRRRALDAIGLAIGSTLLLTALSIGSAPLGLVLGVVGAGLGLMCLRHLLPEGSLRLAPGRPSVVIAIFAVAFAFFGTEAFVPLSVVELRGGSVALGGLALSAAAVSWTAGSWLQDRAAGVGMRRTLVVTGAGLIAVGIGVTAGMLAPGVPVLVATAGWAIAGLGMGLAYSMLALLMLETSPPGEAGFSSAALQLMFTLGTAFGAGVGGAVVAVSEGGALGLSAAIGIVFAIMAVVALLAVAVGWRVPRGPSEAGVSSERPVLGAPLEHP
jgi:MFS family permease